MRMRVVAGAAVIAFLAARCMSALQDHLTSLWADESGIASVEYALLLAFVAGGIVFAAGALVVVIGTLAYGVSWPFVVLRFFGVM